LRLQRDDLLVHDGHAAVVLHLDVVHLEPIRKKIYK
jgi:hypothetical protein